MARSVLLRFPEIMISSGEASTTRRFVTTRTGSRGSTTSSSSGRDSTGLGLYRTIHCLRGQAILVLFALSLVSVCFRSLQQWAKPGAIRLKSARVGPVWMGQYSLHNRRQLSQWSARLLLPPGLVHPGAVFQVQLGQYLFDGGQDGAME